MPSPVGSPPNNDTGVLAGNIETTQAGPLKVLVGSYAPYSAALEGGAERKAGTGFRSFSEKSKKSGPVKVEFGDSQTAARPFLAPARDASKKAVRKLFADAINAHIRSARSNEKG